MCILRTAQRGQNNNKLPSCTEKISPHSTFPHFTTISHPILACKLHDKVRLFHPLENVIKIGWSEGFTNLSLSVRILSIACSIQDISVWSRNSSVGIATSRTTGVRFAAEARDSSLLHSFQTRSGAHSDSNPMGSWVSFPGYSCRNVKLTTHLHLMPRSRMMELYLHYRICFHGLVLNYFSRGKILPVPKTSCEWVVFLSLCNWSSSFTLMDFKFVFNTMLVRHY
jgi:hypothetical protein